MGEHMKISFTGAVDDGAGHWVVSRVITHDDGTEEHGVHIFPYDTMEWRAAEYAIDPDDTATLLDIVLMEPYLTEADSNPALALHAAPTLEDARAAHVARCAAVKLRHRISTRGHPHLDRIRTESPLHQEVVAVKRDIVEAHRARHRAQRLTPLRVDLEARLREWRGHVNRLLAEQE